MKYHMSDYLNHVRGFAERGLTIGQIQIIRSWLSAKGFENQLVIVRENDRNRIYIRIMLARPVDFEAAWLFSLRSERLSRAKLADIFLQRMQVAV